jgi:hypothetical protein
MTMTSTPACNSSNSNSSERRFCYHCRTHHHTTEMRRIVSRNIVRWRCIASIKAARQGAAMREAFGQQTTAANRADSQRRMELINRSRYQREA